MTNDQIFFTLLWLIGIPLGMILFRYEERKDYKDWLKREKEYIRRYKNEN